MLTVWVISIFLFINFTWIATCNLWIVLHYYFRMKHGSLIPGVGGIIGVLAIIMAPLEAFKHYWWIPLFVDIGCIPLLIITIVFFFRGKHKKKKI